MKNGQIEEKDLIKAYVHLYQTSQTEEYKLQLIWWLDENTRISDKVRDKLKLSLIKSPRL